MWRLSNRRSIGAGRYDTPTPWLAGVALTPTDRAQLLAITRLFAPTITETELLSGDARFFQAHVQALAESPIEWWDIGDAAPRYQLWICHVDAGYLFGAGETTRLATIIEGAFDLDHELPASVRAAIAAAAADVRGPPTLVSTISFDV